MAFIDYSSNVRIVKNWIASKLNEVNNDINFYWTNTKPYTPVILIRSIRNCFSGKIEGYYQPIFYFSLSTDFTSVINRNYPSQLFVTILISG